MRGPCKQLWVLIAPAVTLLLRVPFLLGREGLYGYDPYIHLYFAKAWQRFDSWPVLGGGGDIIPHDYTAWPGSHVLVASVSDLGIDPMEVMTWLPLLFLFLLDMAIVLLLLRRTSPAMAAAGGVLFGLLDFIFLQTQWFVPELLGLLFVAVLLLNETSTRKRSLSFLLLMATLVTHHLSFLIALVFWVMLSRGRPDRTQAVMAVALAVATFLFWDLAMEETGSFPDIQDRLLGFHPALVAIGGMAALMAAKWTVSVLAERYVDTQEGATLLDLARERLRDYTNVSVVLGVSAVTLVVVAVYLPSVERFDGIGVQPSKLLMLAGGLLFMAYAPVERDLVKVTGAFALVACLFILNPLIFEFLPLEVRFLEFLYIPGTLLLVVGAFHLASKHPGRARAVLLALVLVCPVLYADDVLRYSSDDSQRFAYTSEDLDFAEAVGKSTEPEARIVAPFGLAPLMVGISGRRASTHPIQAAMEGNGYYDALPFLEELAAEMPVYLVDSADPTMYIQTEHDTITQADMDDLESSLAGISGRLTLVLEGEGHVLYRFG